MAVLDGVPGDPNDDRGTQIILDRDDGVLVAAEVEYLLYGPATRTMIRRRARGAGASVEDGESCPYVLKLGIGTWVYSKNLDRVDRTRPDGTPIDEQGHPGVYAFGDWDAYSEDVLSLQGLSVFARLGIADDDVQQIAGFAGGGLVYTGPFRAVTRTGWASQSRPPATATRSSATRGRRASGQPIGR